MTHEIHSIAATTHGRVLVRRARGGAPRGVLVGFHGYSESAAIQLARLEQIPGSESWTLISVQGLHRFYRGRAQEVGASWMTREDREAAIADNLAYVAAALRTIAPAGSRVVYAGFSQGVPMAFRAAVLGPRTGNFEPAGVIGVGGDVPPELLADHVSAFPPVLLLRGTHDEWYTAAKFDADVEALRASGVALQTVVYDAPHEWTPAVSEAAGAWLAR